MFVGFFFLIDCFKFKFNPIYFKQTKIIQDVMFILTQKNQMQNVVLVTTIFGGCNVLLPKGHLKHL
jgi:hypothetical protein